MRRVELQKTEWPPGARSPIQVPDGEGWFHEWGVDFEEFSGGPAMFTAAVVERDDGAVEMKPVTMVRFIEPAEQA